MMQCLLAILMAVPLHLCCWTGQMQAMGDGAACTGCHQFLEPGERPPVHEAPRPARHCACCDDTLLRQAAPASVSAPAAGMRVLPVAAFLPPWELPVPMASWAAGAPVFRNAHAPPEMGGVPLFQRHCALLL